MPFNYNRTKRPHEALLDLYIDKVIVIVECRRETQVVNGTPPFAISESNLCRWNPAGNNVWLLVCLGQAPAKK
jgi:hypothetical protein